MTCDSFIILTPPDGLLRNVNPKATSIRSDYLVEDYIIENKSFTRHFHGCPAPMPSPQLIRILISFYLSFSIIIIPYFIKNVKFFIGISSENVNCLGRRGSNPYQPHPKTTMKSLRSRSTIELLPIQPVFNYSL